MLSLKNNQYLILCLYTYLPPLRGQDFFNTRVYEHLRDVEDEENNYIVLSKKKLYIKKYKTENTYGARIIDLPDVLVDEITYFTQNTGSNILIPKLVDYPNNVDKFISSKVFTETLNATFGKKVSSSMLRKMYVSENIDKLNGKQRKELSKIMAHNTSTQVINYTRFNKNIHPDKDEK